MLDIYITPKTFSGIKSYLLRNMKMQHLSEANKTAAVSSLLSYSRQFRRPQGNRRADDGRKVRGTTCSSSLWGISQVSCCLSPAEQHIEGRVVWGVMCWHLNVTVSSGLWKQVPDSL